MMNIMRADLYRIFRSVGIYAAIIIVVAIAAVSVGLREPGYVGVAVSVTGDGEEIRDIDLEDLIADGISERGDEENKALVRQILGSNINLYYPLIIVVFVLLMSDFSNRTIKNTLTSVVSKKTYYFSKLALVLLFSAAFILLSNLFAYVLNFIVNGRDYTEGIGNTLKVTAMQLPMLLGVVSLLVMLGVLVKRAAIFNAVVIPLVVVFQTVVLLLQDVTKSELLQKFMQNYELQTALGKLAFFPEKKFVLICACIGFSEMILFSVLGYLIFTKSEIA